MAKHVCPLQLELIRRCVLLYSNPISIQPDVTVLDPFMGIGSTAYVCLSGHTHCNETAGESRNVVGFELKESYYDQSLRNVEKARKADMGRLGALGSLGVRLLAGTFHGPLYMAFSTS